MHAQMHVLAHISPCFVCYKKSFRFDTSWLLVVLGFFQTVLFKAILHSPDVFLWLVLADSAIFFLLVCIHTEIRAFCMRMSTCGSIIHRGKKVKTEWSFSFEMLCLEIYFLPATVIENSIFYYSFYSPLRSF